MATTHMLKGHVDTNGTLVLDEPAPFAPGPVLVTIQPIEEWHPHATAQDAVFNLEALLAEMEALDVPAPSDDGLTAKDYKHILYGPQNGQNDVL